MVGLELAGEPSADEIAAGDVVDGDDDDGVIAAVNDDLDRAHRANGNVRPRHEPDSLHAYVLIHANTSDAPLECDFPALHGPAFASKSVCTVLHSHTVVPLQHRYSRHRHWLLNWLQQPLPRPLMLHLWKILCHLWCQSGRRSTLSSLYLLAKLWLCHPYYLVCYLRWPLLLASSLAPAGH